MGLVFEDLLGVEILHLGLIAQHLEVCTLEQLRPALSKLLPDGLLHRRVAQLTLARWLPRDQLVDCISRQACESGHRLTAGCR